MVIPNRVNKFEITVNELGGIHASHLDEDFTMYFPSTELFNLWLVEQMPLDNKNKYKELKESQQKEIENNIFNRR